jgi:hypothetical protein
METPTKNDYVLVLLCLLYISLIAYIKVLLFRVARSLSTVRLD